jgi:hypothetical protein
MNKKTKEAENLLTTLLLVGLLFCSSEHPSSKSSSLAMVLVSVPVTDFFICIYALLQIKTKTIIRKTILKRA